MGKAIPESEGLSRTIRKLSHNQTHRAAQGSEKESLPTKEMEEEGKEDDLTVTKTLTKEVHPTVCRISSKGAFTMNTFYRHYSVEDIQWPIQGLSILPGMFHP